MKTNLLNTSGIAKGNDLELLSLLFSFLYVCTLLQGVEVEEVGNVIQVKDKDGEVLSSETGAREFLNALISINWNFEELNELEKETLTKIKKYLELRPKQEETPKAEGESYKEYLETLK